MQEPEGYFLSAEEIASLNSLIDRINRANKNIPNLPGSQAVDHEEFFAPELYVARTPIDGIAAIREIHSPTGTGTINDVTSIPGNALCNIYKVEGTREDAVIRPVTGFRNRVYNFSACSIPGNGWIFIVRDKYGTWYAIDVCHTTTTGTTTTGTTTTPEPCFGTCRWKCTTNSGTGTGLDVEKRWELIAYNCLTENPDTGTGSSVFDDPNTGTGTGSSGGSDCNCLAPLYCCEVCGTEGEETVTSCARGIFNSQPICHTTTTTTTTSTTPDPNTTTTTSPGCGGCVWICVGGQWTLSTKDCSGFNCINQCEEVSGKCNESDPCPKPVITPCNAIPVTTVPPHRVCSGWCFWGWTDAYFGGPQWAIMFSSQGCNDPSPGSGDNVCICLKPSTPGHLCGSARMTPCGDTGDPGGEVELAPMFIDGAVTEEIIKYKDISFDLHPFATPFTTTTAAGCTGTCRWQWSTVAQTWFFSCTDCAAGCLCVYTPDYDGVNDEETAELPCSDTTTTTSTTTTTTTTPPPCSGECFFLCSVGFWIGTHSTCIGTDPDCGCTDVYPSAPCVYPNDYNTTTALPCSNTTTTTTTTTSTTTVTTTTGPPECYCTELQQCYPGENCFADECTGPIDVVCRCPLPTPFNPCLSFGSRAYAHIRVLSGPYPDSDTCLANCTTTETTPCPCGEATWAWNTFAGEWQLREETCVDPCDYLGAEPGFFGAYNGQLVTTCCISDGTTTTTTTTAPPGVCGTCTWEWSGTFWSTTSEDCTGGCLCDTPVGSGSVIGETRVIDCI
jgi:hypothetical protein